MFDKNVRIETKRLLIRPFSLNDRDGIFNIMKEKEMFKYTPDDKWISIDDADEFIQLALRLYNSTYHEFRHFFAIIEIESGNLIGYCGIGGIAYDHSENEVFYGIGKDYWKKGYATEAGEAMLEYAFFQLGLNKIIGAVDSENIASVKVLEKIGLKRVGVISGLPEEFTCFNGEYLYILNKAEYSAKR